MMVYFDHNSTTKVDEAVLEQMMPYFSGVFGNASSRHDLGTDSRIAVDTARGQVAKLVGVEASQVIFTSGGTEANNMFLSGMASYLPPARVFTSQIEHPCVSEPSQRLQKMGWNLHQFETSTSGVAKVDALADEKFKQGDLITLMLANNETGVLQPVSELGDAVAERGGWLHTDAVQALGKVRLDFETLGVHSMSLSAHKINGPKGVGALIVDKKLPINPFILGGGHESGLRSGTENVPGIVGFGAAAELVLSRLDEYEAKVKPLQTQLEGGLTRLGAIIHGGGEKRLSNTTYFSFQGVQGETFVIELNKRGFALASGSACSRHGSSVSPTLTAMGVSEELALCAVRISLGLDNTHHEVELFLESVESVLASFSNLSSVTI